MSDWIRRLRRFVLFRVLHADDPPHVLALGFGIGLFVAMTPTIGIQMVLAAAIAAALGGNKLISAAAVWISNPVTMIYIYYVNWRVGQHFVETSIVDGESAVQEQINKIVDSTGGISNIIFHLFDKVFWSEVLGLVWSLGVELWIGSFVVGLVCAIPGYFLVYGLIVLYRQKFPRPRGLFRRSRRRASSEKVPSAKPTLRNKSC